MAGRGGKRGGDRGAIKDTMPDGSGARNDAAPFETLINEAMKVGRVRRRS